MTDIRAHVQQQSRSVNNDGYYMAVPQFREGGLVTADVSSMYQHWLREGRVFETHNATIGTSITVEANATGDLTEPFWRATVPASIVCVPIKIQIAAETVWTTADYAVAWTSDTDTYSAGGLAGSSALNMAAVSSTGTALKSSVLTSVYNSDTVLTEAALTNPRCFHVQTLVGTVEGIQRPVEYNILKGDPMIMIHGESSWGVTFQATAAEEVNYSIIWAELDKNSLVNS